MNTTLPKEYPYLVLGHKLGGAIQRDLIFWINALAPRSRGRMDWVSIPVQKFAVLCHCNSVGSISRELTDLTKRGIIGCETLIEGAPSSGKRYKLLPKNWKRVEAYPIHAKKTSHEEKFENPGFYEPETDLSYHAR